MQSLQNGRWWVGNSLTILRLIAGFAYPFVPKEWRIILLVFAGLSDLVDGWLSRLLHATTLTGQVLDPIADKVCVAAVLLTAWIDGSVGLWELLLVAARDYVVAIVVVIALTIRPGSWRSMPPRLTGKLATAAQFLFLVDLVWFSQRTPWLFALTAFASIVAAVDYAWAAVRYWRLNPPPPRSS